ncbi:hypothetical protein E4T47_05959 [Aureobasidium subglaciale]|nr:hypothetical protein E4T47_05959 [Aureobasidium subglaciale]
MSMTLYTWLATQRAAEEKWTTNSTDKQENNLILSTLESLLLDQLSAQETAIHINDILSPRLISGTRAGVSWLWGKVADAVKYFGGSHTNQLVDLHIAIRKLPDIVNGYGYKITYAGKVIWRELPYWGWIFAEHAVDINYPEGFSYDEWHAQAPERLNASIFCASLMQKSEDWKTEMAFHAHDAFKEVMDGFDEEEREVADAWKMWIPPAVAWIEIAGDVLHKLCFEEKGVGGIERSAMMKSFCAERWAEWKSRFEELAAQEEIDEHCRFLARRAAMKMQATEMRSDFPAKN